MGFFGNLFGGRRPPAFDPSSIIRKPPYFTPGIGDGLGQSDGPLVEQGAPMGTARPDPSRRVFGSGDVGGIIGGLGKLLAYGPFVGMAQEGMNRRHDRDALEDEYRQSQIDRRNAPQGVPLGNGGFGTWSPEGGFSVLREPDAPEQHDTSLMQNIAALRKLNPGMTDAQAAAILERAMSGYDNSPEAIAAKERSQLRVKGAPSYSNMHPHTAPRAAPKPPAGFILDN